MLKLKSCKVALLAIAVIGLGLAPTGVASAGSCPSERSSHSRWDYSRHNDYRHSNNHWQSHGSSYHDRHSYRHDSTYSRVNAGYRHDNVRLSVSFGSSRSYDSCAPVVRTTTCSTPVIVYNPPPSGYWTRVYHSPVYETRYDSCGRPYRVCVREGYYERVWVSHSRY